MEMITEYTEDTEALDAGVAANAFAVLGSDVRLSILRLLVRAGNEGTPVGSLQARLGIAASTLSHHLRAMTQAGVVVQERDGRVLNCRANYDLISDLAAFLLEECCVDQSKPLREPGND